MSAIRIIFDGPPGPESGRFVEAENERGESINAGEWREINGGLWELHIESGEDRLRGLLEQASEYLYGGHNGSEGFTDLCRRIRQALHREGES